MQLSLALMMGMLMTGGDNDHAPLRKQTSILNIPAPVTAVSDDSGPMTVAPTTDAPITTWSQTEPMSTSTYYLEGADQPQAGHIHAAGGSCAECDARRGLLGNGQAARMLHLFRSPGDMPIHIPYIAEPKNYYYFRPYNWFHIPEQQREVLYYHPPGDVRDPYDARFLQDIYIQMEEKYGGIEILPRDLGDRGASPNDTLPTPDNAGTTLLPLQTYGNRNQADFDPPALFPTSTARRVGR